MREYQLSQRETLHEKEMEHDHRYSTLPNMALDNSGLPYKYPKTRPLIKFKQ